MLPEGLDARKLNAVREREHETFRKRTRNSAQLHARARRTQPSGVPMSWMAGMYVHAPLFVAHGAGAWFEDVDGNRYLDMNLADFAGALGFAVPAVSDALARRAAGGASFLLPTEDGIVATELLAGRTGLPYWQFAGAASSANAELIRLARFVTGRDRIVMFRGKYHGHIDDTLVTEAEDGGGLVPEGLGLTRPAPASARIVPFNDLAALERALVPGDVACVIAEPMLTNCNVVFPAPGFWETARGMIRDAGSLLVIDEAHTFAFAYGGLARAWSIGPDMQMMGKGLGTGVPFAVYGVTEELGRVVEDNLDRVYAGGAPGLALGGTTYGNAVALTAARAALEDCLTEAAYDANARLGARLADGLEALFAKHGRDWRAPRIGGRSGWVLAPDLPWNADEAAPSIAPAFVDAKRLFMANREVWEAISPAGPAASFSHGDADIDHYLAVADAFLAAIA